MPRKDHTLNISKDRRVIKYTFKDLKIIIHNLDIYSNHTKQRIYTQDGECYLVNVTIYTSVL